MPSTSDGEYQGLVSTYGPGLSMSDMKYRKYGGPGTPARSYSDLEDDFWGASNTLSLSDKKYNVLPGGGSMSDKDQVSSVGTPIQKLLSKNPFFVGHRGSGDLYPEHSQIAYFNCWNTDGGDAIEVSAQLTNDGAWFCMHDIGATGLDRTTALTGDPKTLTTAQITAGIPLEAPELGPYWVTTPQMIPFLNTILPYYNNCVIFLESKDYAGAAMDALLAKLEAEYPGYKDKIIWKIYWSATTAYTKGKAKGMTVWSYLDQTFTDPQLATAVANGDFISVVDGTADVDIQRAVATGKMVTMASISRRWDVERCLPLGVKGFIVSDLKYQKKPYRRSSISDSFATQKRGPGNLPFTGTFIAPLTAAGECWLNTTNSTPSVLMGEMCPPSGTPGKNDYYIEFEFKYDVVPGATQHSGIAFCKSDDRVFQTQTLMPVGGYHVVLRQNGQLQLFKHDPMVSAGTQIGATVTTAALNTTDWAKVRVEVTDTTVSIQRLDGTPSIKQSATNTEFRGDYFHISRNHSTAAGEYVRFRKVKVGALDPGNPLTNGPTPLHGFWAGSQVLADDTPVSSWPSISTAPFGNAGGSFSPIYKVADPVMGGKPALQFDGVGRYLTTDIPDFNGSFWLVGIGAYVATLDQTKVMVGTGAAANGGFGRAQPVGTNKWFSNNGASIVANTGPNVDTSSHLVVAGFNAGNGNGTIQIDNIAEIVQTGTSTIGVSWFKVGCGAAGASVGSFWNGSISYAAMFTSDPRLDPKWQNIIEYARSCGVNV